MGTTIALRLAPETRHKLEELARVTGYTRSSLVAEAVRRFVDAEIAALVAGGKVFLTEDTPADEQEKAPAERWNIIV